LFPLSSYRTL